jgi:4-hydroxybenzoate polyprenyltransferase
MSGSSLTKLGGLLKASHFGPTLLVSTISWFFAAHYWWEGPAYVIAVGVLTGQLVVGWSNDLYDYEDDLKHNRQNKPLVSGALTRSYLTKWLRFMVPFSFVANLLGPLGFKGGLVYMFGISMGVAYNFYFKFNVFSWLPYALAFAALPSCVAISKDIAPPVWMWLGGALLGTAAHFINVIKDMEQDRLSGIDGLPQRIGKANSIVAAAVLIALGAAAVFFLR